MVCCCILDLLPFVFEELGKSWWVHLCIHFLVLRRLKEWGWKVFCFWRLAAFILVLWWYSHISGGKFLSVASLTKVLRLILILIILLSKTWSTGAFIIIFVFLSDHFIIHCIYELCVVLVRLDLLSVIHVSFEWFIFISNWIQFIFWYLLLHLLGVYLTKTNFKFIIIAMFLYLILLNGPGYLNEEIIYRYIAEFDRII